MPFKLHRRDVGGSGGRVGTKGERKGEDDDGQSRSKRRRKVEKELKLNVLPNN